MIGWFVSNGASSGHTGGPTRSNDVCPEGDSSTSASGHESGASPGDASVRWARIGVGAATCLFISVAVLSAISLPWRGSLDSPDHLDYVYQVHLGQIPDATGSEFAFPGERVVRGPNARQFASAHPPGYYALIAPVMGPLLDRGRWVVAVAYGRAVNIVLGASGALAMGWFMWRLAGRRRGSIAVAAAAAGPLPVAYVTFSGDIYNDIAVSVCSIAMVGTACIVVRDGLSVRRSLVLVAIAALGMTFKSTHLFAILVSLVAVLFAALWHGGEPLRRRLGLAAATCVGMVVAPVIAIGWFYARNHRRSGSWFRSSPVAPLQGRVERSMMGNLTNPDFYLIVPSRLFGTQRWDLPGIGSDDLSIAVFTVAAVLCMVGLVRIVRGGTRDAVPTLAVPALLTLHLALLYGAQLQHATGFGAYNIRYFLPASLTVAALLAFGVVQTGRFAPGVLLLLISVQVLAVRVSAHAYLRRRYPDRVDGRGVLDGLRNSIEANGLPVPNLMLFACLAGASVSAAVVTYSMSRLTSLETRDVGKWSTLDQRL